jgi:hypothetical protein
MPSHLRRADGRIDPSCARARRLHVTTKEMWGIDEALATMLGLD